MRTIRVISTALAGMLAFISCDVHEFPDAPATRPVCIRLHYDTDMTIWNHIVDDAGMTEQEPGPTEESILKSGFMRYIIRTYPLSEDNRAAYTQEFSFTRDVSEGYNAEFNLDLLPGDYAVMVWADMVRHKEDLPFYNAGNFAEIYLTGDYTGNTDYRDAFRGTDRISIASDIIERDADTLEISMQRPLAKYEFITTDLIEFIDKETKLQTKLNTDDYKVRFHYAGFMPNAYNMNTDRPVDSVAGIMFESGLDILNEHEASLGFDYVFVGENVSGVAVQIGLYGENDKQIALTEPILIPLRRSRHTIIRGSFLMQQATGGIVIDPEFEGNYNIIYELNSK